MNFTLCSSYGSSLYSTLENNSLEKLTEDNLII